MKNIVFQTVSSYAPLFLRLLLGIVFFPHGAQKLLGWFGGYGFKGTMGYLTGQVGLPWIVAFFVIIIEFFGPIFLFLGLATRIWSLGILGLLTGIVATTINDYFFMNWSGTQPAEGYEFFLLAIGMALSLIITGAGTFSIDAIISKKDAALLQGPDMPFHSLKKRNPCS